MLCQLRKALTQPGFLAKNQLPESLPEPIVIPGLSQFCGSDTDVRLLCPVRAVRAYLSRMKAKRSGRKRLFLPLKGSKDISPSTISRWICDVIKLAYADLSSSDMSFMKISAHEVRALSSSWAYWNEDVVRAAYWRTNSTFSSFYLIEIWPQLGRIHRHWDLKWRRSLLLAAIVLYIKSLHSILSLLESGVKLFFKGSVLFFSINGYWHSTRKHTYNVKIFP